MKLYLCNAVLLTVALLLPGLSSPPLGSALLMAVSGISWGFYCVFGREVRDPTLHTAGNFIRCLLH